MILNVCKKLIEIIYPPLCLCCKERTEHLSHLFCTACLEHLTLLDPEHRCRCCFASTEGTGVCRSCITQHAPFKRHAAACENFGPPCALLAHLERGEYMLAKTIGSLMVMQHIQLDWPLPDWIVPCPTHLFPGFCAQGKFTRCVASEIAKIFERPLCSVLKKMINYSYFGNLDSKLEPTQFSSVPHKKADLADKTLLLISLSAKKEEVAQACEQLQGFFPKEISSISFL